LHSAAFNINLDPWEVVLHDFPLVHGWFLKTFQCAEFGMTEKVTVCEGKKKAFANMCGHAKQTSIDVSIILTTAGQVTKLLSSQTWLK